MTATDILTNLPNRMALEAQLKQGLDAADGVALALLDIDHFLDINQTYGMEVGDQVLRTLAGLVNEALPGCVYRVGGDELAVLLEDSSLEQAFLRLEALRAQVEAAQARFGVPDGRVVTMTVGVAQHPRDARDGRGLLEAADAALSSAKEGGRNQVGLAPNEQMVMKSCYYPATSIRKLKGLAERLKRKESRLLREALDDLFRKYDLPTEA